MQQPCSYKHSRQRRIHNTHAGAANQHGQPQSHAISPVWYWYRQHCQRPARERHGPGGPDNSAQRGHRCCRRRCSPSRTGPLTLRMIRRFWSSRNLTRTCVTCTTKSAWTHPKSEILGGGTPARCGRMPDRVCRPAAPWCAALQQPCCRHGLAPPAVRRPPRAAAAWCPRSTDAAPLLRTCPRLPVRPMTFITIASFTG